MKKSKEELEQMASAISEKYGSFLTVTDVSKILGINRDTARKILKDITPATVEGSRKYYLFDVLKFIYK